jgi:hypothetical protein
MSKEKSVRPRQAAEQRRLRNKANANARDQFAALGLFLQSFEQIVQHMRDDCRWILMGGHRGVSFTEAQVMSANWNICSLPFHHEAMTTRPIAEIWRALVTEDSAALLILSKLTDDGKSVVAQVTTEIVRRFSEIIDERNRLIHATWRIGFWFPDEDFSIVRVEKYKVGKDGLTKRDDLPDSFDAIMALARKAQKLSGKLGRFMQFYRFNPEKLEHVFKRIENEWIFVPPAEPNGGRKRNHRTKE